MSTFPNLRDERSEVKPTADEAVQDATPLKSFPMTLFPDHRAKSAQRLDLDLAGLTALWRRQPSVLVGGRNLSDVQTYKVVKGEQALILWGTVGNNRSPEGSLKTYANLETTTGCAFDVDPSKLRQGQTYVPFEQVLDRLREHNIYAMIRQSTGDPSGGVPFHVYLPFGEARSVPERQRFWRWINKVVLDSAADTGAKDAAHGFYFGRLEGRNADAEPVVVDGEFVDLVVGEDELGPILDEDRVGYRSRTAVERAEARRAASKLDEPNNIARVRAWLQGPAKDEFEFGGNRFKVACRCKDMGVSEATCLDLMLEFWEAEGDFDGLEFRVRNAYAFGQNQPGCETPEVWFRDAPILHLDGAAAAPADKQGSTPTVDSRPPAGAGERPIFAGGVNHDSLASAYTASFPNSKFDEVAGVWMLWTGVCWTPDRKGRVVAARLRELAKIGSRVLNEPARDKALSTPFLRHAEYQVRIDPRHSVASDAWDANPWLLGTPGGTVDLCSGQLRPAAPGDMITRLTAVAPGEGEAGRWSEFLRECTAGDPELLGFLHRWLGYACTGVTTEEVFVDLDGPGGNGKSKIIEAASYTLGDYSTVASMDTFTVSRGDKHPTDLAALRGARLVISSETGLGKTWDEVRIKQLTGGDTISARYMRQDFFSFKPEFKLMIAANHQPRLNVVDDAMRRRMRVIPFTAKPKVVDGQLLEKLKAEAPQILAWMIAGCLAWQRDGLGSAAVMRRATHDYFESQDVFGAWLSDRCVCRAGTTAFNTASAALFADWSKYARDRNEAVGNHTTFGASLKRRGFGNVKKRIEGAPQWCWMGIELLADADLDVEMEEDKPSSPDDETGQEREARLEAEAMLQ